MRPRTIGAALLALSLVVGLQATTTAASKSPLQKDLRRQTALPKGYKPLFLQQSSTGRYIVTLKSASLAQRLLSGAVSGSSAQRSATAEIESSQSAVIKAVRAAGGRVIFRYSRLVNALSVELSRAGALRLARRADVKSIEAVRRVTLDNSSSVPFIGAPTVWKKYGALGQGMTIAVIDTGADYTHADFGGPGTVPAYENNNPTVVEPGTFPTAKVIEGFDFVGEFYDPFDDNPENDIPRPDRDPLDLDGHGTHVSGTALGRGVAATGIGPGVAPRAKLMIYKVFAAGSSTTTDAVVAGMDRAMDPNEDGSTSDHADVISMSLGSTYGDETSADAIAAERATRLGSVVVAAAGNAGPVPYVTDTPAAAPSAISVAAIIDEFNAQHVLVNIPNGVSLPDGGTAVHQDWSVPVEADITNDVLDAREFDAPDDPSGAPSPSDQQLCQPVAGSPFAGKIALVFKGSTGEGDCDGSTKVFNAQEAGASAVILWSGFPGSPFGLAAGEHADEVNISAVMVSGSDGEVLGATASPEAPDTYNSQQLNVTIEAEVSEVPGFADRIADFSSQGPARITNALKPDVAAPGVDITSAGAGTGNDSATISGTSMATPHIAGVAALMKQLHPTWSSDKIKALVMNKAKREVTDNSTGESVVPAVLAGSGRVRAAESASSVSLAFPSSLSFGLQQATGTQVVVRSFTVQNFDTQSHSYSAESVDRYFDFDPDVANVTVSPSNFSLQPGQSRKVNAAMVIDPSLISPPEQEFGWVAFHGTMDGQIRIRQTGGGRPDRFNVVWGVVPANAADTDSSPDELDLGSGSDTLTVTNDGTGLSHADAYIEGASDEAGSHGEEDVLLTGARSFTGDSIDGQPEGDPQGAEPLFGLGWIDFLSAGSAPSEPVEFAAVTSAPHSTTDTVEVNVLIDVGADGIFADPALGADFLLTKPRAGATTCVFDLSDPDAVANGDCSATYFHDYGLYNTDVWGLVADAQAIGLSDSRAGLAYQVQACIQPGGEDVFCDAAGAIDPDTGTYTSLLNTTNPVLDIEPLVCGGFFGDSDCSSIEVSTGSSAAEDPQILMLYPNNAAGDASEVISTTTGS